MAIAEYVRVIRAQWPIIIIMAFLGGSIAFTYSFIQDPTYKADVQLFVSTRANDKDNSQLNQGGTFSQQRVKSYADIVTSPAVIQPVIESLNLPYSVDELGGRIATETPLDTVLLNISVTDTSAKRARAIANEIAVQLPRLIDEIETPSGQSASPVKVSVTREATLPSAPIGPRTKLNLALGLLLGIAIGVGTAIVRNAVDHTIRDKSDAIKAANAPVLGSVPDETKVRTSALIADEQATPRAEAFRQLRTNLRFLSLDRQLTSFVITGAVPEEGKTTTAANLAIALAQSGQRVVLVDADLRRPRVADVFALSNGLGLTNVLLGEMPVDRALQQWRVDLPLYVLAAGPRPPNPSELLGSPRLRKVIESLESSGMTVIFDSPPLLPVTDAAVIARITRGALVVTRVGRTGTDQLAEAVESLRTVGANVLGLVANRVKKKAEWSYYDLPAPRRSRSKK
ncbi:polysaccharide biosynthesis tyrosine autokinase [Micromonospora sp. ATA51]|uniref:polysaccharide biosynthesis tyrosine autokinase n=1 Tax=Micromonospora sp. ATA51 TaxID=2806098 RepID=UPI001A4FBB77|nr:polysaccharide biosynthesis tyrosine autokinase [Micromonospora sp. ATA51]MBM0225702.1 polysaccharide biosynthesis tyrosine autokinase [Micromonospora sp. ATA51]